MNAIEVDTLVKRFPGHTRAAVDGISFSVEAGAVHGLLGQNGSGKSTTLRILSTLMAPTSGRVRVAGYDPATQPQAVRQHIGVFLDATQSFYQRLTARENLHRFADLQGIATATGRKRADDLLSLFNLQNEADKIFMRLSAGMRLRLGIARALLPEAPVVLLDEPWANLDPVARRDLSATVARLAGAEGRTVLATTHDLRQIETLCSKVTIMDRGRVVVSGDPKALVARMGDLEALTLFVESDHATMIGELKEWGGSAVEGWTGEVHALLPNARKFVEWQLAENGSRLSGYTIRKPNLEDFYIGCVRHGLF